MTSKYSIYTMFLFLLCFSCKKEKPPIPLLGVGGSSNHCPEMYQKRTSEYADTLHFTDTQPGCVVMWEAIYQQSWVYGSYSINPNNEYEFVSVRNNPEQPQFGGDLCIYNFCTNQVKILTKNALGSTSWSIKNKILYVGDDLHLYLVNSDGSEKTNLINQGINMHPKWSPDGTKFVYKNITDNPNRLRICDENGEIIKTITGNINSWNWRNNDEITFTNDGYIKIFDLSNESTYNIMNQTINGLENLENIGLISLYNKIYFKSFDGLYVLENSGEHTLIENTYYTYNVGSLEKLNNEKLILFRSVLDTSAYPCSVYTKHYTSVYDIETQNERYINILSE